MRRNVVDAFKLYSGDKPYQIFVLKLPGNLQKLNKAFTEIRDLFDNCGIENFERLPEEQADRAMFAKHFQELNQSLYASRLQGFTWDDLNPKMPDGSIVEVLIDEETYNILLQRYHELSLGGGGGDDGIQYDIDTQISELATGKINTDYMNANFTKYVRSLQANNPTEDQQRLLNSLHKSYAALSQEEQSYANVFLTEFMNGGIQLEEGKTFHDYIVEYQTRARDNRTQRFADALGLDAELLRDAMRNVFSESDITNALLKPIKDSMDLQKAKSYFEQKEGTVLPMRKVMVKVDDMLRKFILQGGFEIDPIIETEESKESAATIVILNPEDVPQEQKYIKFLPVYSVRAACGSFDDYNMIPDEEAEGWVDISEAGFRANRNMIVVHAKGDSMLDKIHDGDLCVFELYGPNNAGSREGKIVLTRCKDKDTDYDCSFTIKEYHSVKKYYEDGSWEHEKIELRPLNKDFDVIELEGKEYKTIGVFKCVL